MSSCLTSGWVGTATSTRSSRAPCATNRPTWISLKAGINVINADSLKKRTFAPALHGFIDTVRDGKPETPFLVVSPIVCPSAEDRPGPTIPREDRVFTTIPGHDELRPGSLTLRRMREIIEAVVAARRAARDANLHYLDGLELFGEADVGDLPDALHPNGDGYVRMGERFARLAFGPGVPLARQGAHAEVRMMPRMRRSSRRGWGRRPRRRSRARL